MLVDAAGAVGLFRSADASLEGVHGERVRVNRAVTVARPLRLAELGLLADWQAEIVRRQIVQPFKRVFREQYVLTSDVHQSIAYRTKAANRRSVELLESAGYTVVLVENGEELVRTALAEPLALILADTHMQVMD